MVKGIFPLWLVGVLCFVSGCAGAKFLGASDHLYEVRMRLGETYYARSQPVLDKNGFYRFEDVNKQAYTVHENLVLFIEPTQVKR